MIILGLTGSIGMGKSTAAAMFRRMGIPVFDSDASVHHALSRNKDVIGAIGDSFPDAVHREVVDRKKLGGIVFNDPGQRRQLETILHPVVQQGQRHFAALMRRAGHDLVVLDIPLLYETGAERRVDYVVCVSAPYRIQRRRVLTRPGMDEARFHAILQQQMPDTQKQAKADFIVQTGLGYALTYRELRDIVRQVRNA
jgi:dephospho-CoA kinase